MLDWKAIAGYAGMGALVALLTGLKSRLASRDTGPALEFPDFPGRYAGDYVVGEREVRAKYQHVVTELHGTYIYRRYFPETLTLTHYKEYLDDSLTVRHGRHAEYRDDGSLKEEGTYHYGRRDGRWTTYMPEGSVVSEQYYRAGVPIGRHSFYDRRGQVAHWETYEDGVVIAEGPANPSGSEPTPGLGERFLIFDKFPRFPGRRRGRSYEKQKARADRRLVRFIARNLQYPANARRLGVVGTAKVSFTITKTGNIEKIEVVRGLNRDIHQELVRLIQSMPDWIPGERNGQPVDVQFNLPVKFGEDGLPA